MPFFLAWLVVFSCSVINAFDQKQPSTPPRVARVGEKEHIFITPEKKRAYTTKDSEIIEGLERLVSKLRKGDFVEVNSYLLTNFKFVHALCALKKKKVAVRVIVDASTLRHWNGRACLDLLLEEGIDVYVFNADSKIVTDLGTPFTNHNKYVRWAYKNSSGKFFLRSAVGSANITNNAPASQEHVLIIPETYSKSPTYNSLEDLSIWMLPFCTKYSDYLKSEAEALKNQHVKKSVKKQLFVVEPEYDSIKTSALSKESIVTSTLTVSFIGTIMDKIGDLKKDDEVVVFTYTFDHKELAHKLSAIARKGARVLVIVDQKALQSNKNLLLALSMMENKVDVRVFEGAEGTFNKNHCKFVLINKQSFPSQKIVIEGAANMTYFAEQSVNQFGLHTDDKIFRDFKEIAISILSQKFCVPLKESKRFLEWAKKAIC